MRKVFKWMGIGLGGLLALVIIIGIVMYFAGNARLSKVYNVEPEQITLTADPAELERGEYLVNMLCTSCHGPDLGGGVVFEQEGIVAINAPNLTTGTGGMGGQPIKFFVLAIRHGIDQDGTPLLVMPAENFVYLSKEDLSAVLAYVSQVPPVDNLVPNSYISPTARVLVMAGMFGKPFPAEYIDHQMEFLERPPIGVNKDYGQYMAGVLSCTLCHGENLAGGVVPPSDPPIPLPPSPNLTPAGDLKDWSEEDFIQALQTGVTPSGYQLNSEFMPWKKYANLNQDDLKALWLYINSLPPIETTNQ